ncbi:MAG: hypothetical protein QOK35_3131, partial [Pseudonocardiales bacterium]|nr:hypothetical protein [Pseudonocardiales bacterium]
MHSPRLLHSDSARAGVARPATPLPSAARPGRWSGAPDPVGNDPVEHVAGDTGPAVPGPMSNPISG